MDQMYQISTLQALLRGYFTGVTTAEELLRHGEIGLGTFQDVNGEMIVLDRRVYRADAGGHVTEADPAEGIPFAAVAFMKEAKEFRISASRSLEDIRKQLDLAIDGDFGLNSMYAVRIDGFFPMIKARSESGMHSRYVELKKVLETTQKDFLFENVSGTIVCLYFPDYMHGINAAGWHFHFISDDRRLGGHVFDAECGEVNAKRCQLHNIEIRLPSDKAYDVYDLKAVSDEDVKKVEQQPS